MVFAQQGAIAQTDRPAHAQRIAQVFDFEEQDLHDAPVPLSWYRAQHNPPGNPHPGFPTWNRATIEYEGAFSGQGCVRLPTRGGSTSLRLRVGVVPVLPGADYTIRAMVRAENLRHAHPAVHVMLVDEAGDVIDATQRRELLPLEDEQWHAVEVLLDEAPPQAVFLQIYLELLQPSALGDRQLGASFLEDLDGAAWFDDVTIMMRPRVSLTSGPASGISTDDQPPELVFSARDLAGDRLDATIRVYDLDGRVIDSHRFRVDASGRLTRWSPSIERYGWYRAVATVHAGSVLIGRASHDLLHLPVGESARPRIGILLGEFDPGDAIGRVQLAESLRLGQVVVPAWRDQTDPSIIERHVEQLASMVDRLRSHRVGVVLTLDRVPDWAAKRDMLDRYQIARFLAADSSTLQVLLDPILERLGQAVTRWVIGNTSERWDPKMSDEIVAGERVLARLVPGPQIVTALLARDLIRASTELELERGILLAQIDGSMGPQAFEDMAAALAETDSERAAEIWLLMHPLDPERFGVPAMVQGLSQQLISIHAEMGDRVRGVLLDMQDQTIPGPPPALAAMAALADRLADGRVVGEYPVGPGVRCYIVQGLSPDEPGTLVAWHDGSSLETPVLEAMLSLQSVSVVDLFANRREVPLSTPDAGGVRTHRIEIPQMPIFIEGIDTPLVRFQGEFAITPDRLKTDNSPHEHDLVFTNPWTAPIEAQFFLVEPGGVRPDGTRDRNWDISPRTGALDILPDQISEITVRIAMSPYQPSGRLSAIVDVELQAGRDYGVVRLKRPLGVGIDDLIERVTHQVRGDQLLIDISLGNQADQARDLEILAFAGTNAARQRSIVTDLEPGAYATRRLAFDRSLAGERIFVSVLDSKTGSRLNTIVEIGAILAVADEP